MIRTVLLPGQLASQFSPVTRHQSPHCATTQRSGSRV